MWNVQIFRAGFPGLAVLCLPLISPARQIPPPAPPAIVRLDGVDQPSGIHYLRLYLDGALLPAPVPPAIAPALQSPPPQLIAQ